MPKSGIDARRKAALEDGGEAYISRREEIIKAAAHVFRDRGFEAATLRDVAGEQWAPTAPRCTTTLAARKSCCRRSCARALSSDIAAAQAVKAQSRVDAGENRLTDSSRWSNSYANNYPAHRTSTSRT